MPWFRRSDSPGPIRRAGVAFMFVGAKSLAADEGAPVTVYDARDGSPSPYRWVLAGEIPVTSWTPVAVVQPDGTVSATPIPDAVQPA